VGQKIIIIVNQTCNLLITSSITINQSISNICSGLSSRATVGPLWGLVKCHRIMSDNDRWNSQLQLFWKADSDLADMTLSGGPFHRCAAATVDNLNSGTRRRYDSTERSARRPGRSVKWTSGLRQASMYVRPASLYCIHCGTQTESCDVLTTLTPPCPTNWATDRDTRV